MQVAAHLSRWLAREDLGAAALTGLRPKDASEADVTPITMQFIH
jgi:hypothetical protein